MTAQQCLPEFWLDKIHTQLNKYVLPNKLKQPYSEGSKALSTYAAYYKCAYLSEVVIKFDKNSDHKWSWLHLCLYCNNCFEEKQFYVSMYLKLFAIFPTFPDGIFQTALESEFLKNSDWKS